ncbi:MAG: O-antigen ligase family protein [Bacilli bacterium]
MPLIVLANVEQVVSPLISNVDVLSSGTKGDLFTHYKALFVVVITIMTGAMLLVKVFFMNGQIRKTPINYVIGLFAFAIILSTVFSPNITVALGGQFNRSDGAISWLCYLALMFIAMNIEYPKNVVNYVMYTMMPFVFINLFIITMNFYGKDLLQYGWMQKIVSITLPEGASISEGSQLLGTLNQWNYMSGMFAMMTVMYLTYSLLSKSNWSKFTTLFIAIVSMAITLMSLSTNGFFTILCITPFIIWIAIKSKDLKRNIASLVIFIICTGGLIHVLASHNEKVWSESVGFLLTGDNPYAEIVSEGINISLLGNSVSASSSEFELPVLPEGKWGAGTGRIYIWKESIKLMEDRPLLGYGLDSLTYHFPHYQLEARGNLVVETIVDKPHNIYVGVLFGVGGIGFILFLVIILYTLKNVFKEIVYVNSKLTTLAIVWLAFLIQSLFNDTTPAIVGVLFIVIGIIQSIHLSGKKVIELSQ